VPIHFAMLRTMKRGGGLGWGGGMFDTGPGHIQSAANGVDIPVREGGGGLAEKLHTPAEIHFFCTLIRDRSALQAWAMNSGGLFKGY
jgi:hypothetical protein